ncbi:hypothetical protein IQ266_10440 [filamentous cyanobacterium LEGE 11480]|uniref:Uncharacterized protein n=1 Tax=Romeriopsis navalis LEGE 11480 TaxID=2777977 RepID=A0A928VM37_9CYAN|nr:hypothetical protein [Romeriopsis navalis]MBE9030147.1 hypothetical protein [Romeriopsis navalis LEGE 11480]
MNKQFGFLSQRQIVALVGSVLLTGSYIILRLPLPEVLSVPQFFVGLALHIPATIVAIPLLLILDAAAPSGSIIEFGTFWITVKQWWVWPLLLTYYYLLIFVPLKLFALMLKQR